LLVIVSVIDKGGVRWTEHGVRRHVYGIWFGNTWERIS